MRLYVIGGQGQIARSLREAAAANDDIIFGCAERPDVDLLRPNSVAQALANFESRYRHQSRRLHIGRQGRNPSRTKHLPSTGMAPVRLRRRPRSRGCPSSTFQQIMSSMEPRMSPMSKATPPVPEVSMDNPNTKENWRWRRPIPAISF